MKATIQGIEYTAEMSQCGLYVVVYDVISEDEADMIGRFLLKGNKLIDILPMSGTEVEVGEVTDK